MILSPTRFVSRLLLGAFLIHTPLRAEVVISEFMASNRTTLQDGEGAFSDWIELYNPDPAVIDLTGWGLRDSAEVWPFPEGTAIQPGGYLLVFASGQSQAGHVDPGGFLHTTFKLDAAGEPLALVRPDSTVAFEYRDVPRQREDVSYGLLTEVIPLVGRDSPARYRIPDGELPSGWLSAEFDDRSWGSGSAAIGYHLNEGPVLGGGAGAHTAYLVEAETPGNQAYSGSLGMDFEVVEEVWVTHLGVFDDRADGLDRTITAELWSRSGGTGGSVLVREVFTPGDDGQLEGGSRFKPLVAPLILSPGSYTMVAHGYGSGERNGNQGVAALDGLDIDTANGAIQFVGDSRFGPAGSFPTNVDGGPSNRYAAGTFKFSSNPASDFETDIEALMHGINSSLLVRVPFDLDDPGVLDSVQLNLGVDDGFRAWINGVEIASLHAPPSLSWNSGASAEGNVTMLFPAVLPEGTLRPSGNVLAMHGLNRDINDDDFVLVPTLSGIGHDLSSARYFTAATPGTPNDPQGISGFVADTKFSVDRGFYDAPIEVEITTATAGATIRYTTDSSTPTASHGQVYSGPVTISGTTILRAAAFKDGFEPSNVDTQSYLFLGKVAVQGDPLGYPARWGPIPADYAMDRSPTDYSRAAGDANYTRSEARSALIRSLKSLPSLSIVTDREHLFDPATGIYLNPSGRGEQWERPVSVEVIGEDGVGRYQTDAGLRIMGFTSRNLNLTPKLNMRLLFKREYGDGQLRYPILGPEGPDEFNTIALRGNIRDAWVAEASGFGSAFYIGDEWAKRSQFAMGQPAVRGTFAHVYLNGIYWGLYNPTERPDDAFAETYLGGDKTEYDVVKFCCPDRSIAGSTAVWDDLRSQARAGLGSNAAYQRIQGNNVDGDPRPGYPVLIDIDNFIDYVINGHYHAQVDWPGNYYVIRDRLPGRSEGFKFFTWDNDIPFAGGNPASGNKVQTSPGHNWWTESPGEIEIPLRANAEYRMRFADRVYMHYHHGGAMTVERNIARWNELAGLVRPALFAESARWGDAKGASLRTVQDHWDAQNARMLNEYFPNRQAVVFNQLRTHDLYPNVDPPEFNQHGGLVRPDFGLRFSADANVYYTLDGSDPRLVGGGINPVAERTAGELTTEWLVESGAPARALVPGDASVDATWRGPAFDDAGWMEGTTGVGYEAISGYEPEIGLDLNAVMFGQSTTAYIRVPFGGAEGERFQSLTLRMKYDDGFVAYLNGVEIASRNRPVGVPAWDSEAGASNRDQHAMEFEDIDVSLHKNLLRPTGNVLAIHGLNFGASSSDFLIVPELRGASLSGGDVLALQETTHVRARAFDGSEWSALNEATFIVGTPPDPTKLVVSEIMYHPVSANPAGEFLEVMNISEDLELDLTGVHFSDGIEFTFPRGFTLAPGERAVVVADAVAFAAAHPGVRVAGIFSGALNNGGERIALSDSTATEFLSFSYDNNLPWPADADGRGASLVLIAPQTAPDHALALSWRASLVAGGVPGESDAVPFVSGDLLAYAFGGIPRFDYESMTLSVTLRPGADDAVIIPQWSTDLQDWREHRFQFLGGSPAQWRFDDPPLENPRRFLRFRVLVR